MTYRCIGCGAAYGHKTGLSNHWRHCYGWKNYDRVTEHRRRRWEMRTLGPNLGHNLQVPSETPGPAQPNDMSLEVRKSLLLCIIYDCSLSIRIQLNIITIMRRILLDHLRGTPPQQRLLHRRLHDLDITCAFLDDSTTIYPGC